MLYTGKRLDAPQALDWGLVNHIVPTADIPGAVQHYAGELIAWLAAQ